ncbi:MAG: magnesium transporter [Pirellulaceae bacterium]|nr:magnesium transporter [Pirellulaceae bacterium]
MNEHESPNLNHDHPWDQLRELIRQQDVAKLEAFIGTLASGEIARTISRLDAAEQRLLLTTLPAVISAELIEEFSETQAVELVERLEPAEAGAILQEMESDEQADILSKLTDAEADAILATMDPEDAASVRHMVGYEADTAGGLMINEVLCYADNLRVRDVLDDLRANKEIYSDYEVQYAYVVQQTHAPDEPANPVHFGKLVGVLRLRDLLLSQPDTTIASLMIANPLSVVATASLEELFDIFDRRAFLGLPIVDSLGRLVGVVRRHDVEEARVERADDDNLKLLGIVGGEELRTMPLATRAGWRLSWLIPNILLNVIAISVIAIYEVTIQEVIALSVLLPLISDMGGNAGIQAIAVSIRELNLGLLKSHEILWVAIKEGTVGLVNGLVLGVIIAFGTWLWKGNLVLGLVVGVAMAINTLVATTVGGIMPLLLKRMKFDPALASGPVLTTITDMSGFFLVLSLAAALLPWIT